MTLPTIFAGGEHRVLNCVLPASLPSTLEIFGIAHPDIPESQWRDTSLLDDFPLAVKDQGRENICVGEANTYGTEILYQQAGNGVITFNPWFTYNIVSPNNQGASITDAFEVAKSVGLLPEDGSLPHQFIPAAQMRQRYPQLWTVSANYKLEFGYHTPTYDNIGTAAQLGLPTVIGVPVYQSWMQVNASNPVIRNTGQFLGWHAILVTGYKRGAGLEFINSWNVRWGLAGKAYLPRAAVREPVDGAAMQNLIYSDKSEPFAPVA